MQTAERAVERGHADGRVGTPLTCERRWCSQGVDRACCVDEAPCLCDEPSRRGRFAPDETRPFFDGRSSESSSLMAASRGQSRTAAARAVRAGHLAESCWAEPARVDSPVERTACESGTSGAKLASLDAVRGGAVSLRRDRDPLVVARDAQRACLPRLAVRGAGRVSLADDHVAGARVRRCSDATMTPSTPTSQSGPPPPASVAALR